MSGNVYEWVWDGYNRYSSGSQIDPTGSTASSTRVSRGGSYNSSARRTRISHRYYLEQDQKGSEYGFRLRRLAEQ